MSRLKNPKRPPALYYVVSLGGKEKRVPYKGNSPTVDMLVKEVGELYSANADVVPDDLRQRIEDQICSRNSSECWPQDKLSPAKSEKPKRFRLPSIQSVTSATKALFEHLVGNTESQDIIEARSNVCRSCPLRLVTLEEKNASEVGCLGCGGKSKQERALAETAATIAKATDFLHGNFTIPPDLEKNVCGACGCWLSFLLSTKGDTIKQKETPEQLALRPDSCWIKNLQ